MPLNEGSFAQRSRWPLSFDLEGAPRANAERERLVELEKRKEEIMDTHIVQNNFGAPMAEAVVDINNPNVPRYGTKQNPFKEYPKHLYPANYPQTKVAVVNSAEQEKKFLKQGYTLQPPVVEEQAS